MINTDQIPVACDIPYPPITIIRPNKEYAIMITPAIRACRSELTTITSYLYQHWIIPPEHKALAETIMRISKVEMGHLNMMGKLITLLGGDPKFLNDPCEAWNANAINYSRDLRTILQTNIEEEMGSRDFYSQQAAIIDDPYVANVLNRLALDEQLHANIFESYLKRL